MTVTYRVVWENAHGERFHGGRTTFGATALHLARKALAEGRCNVRVCLSDEPPPVKAVEPIDWGKDLRSDAAGMAAGIPALMAAHRPTKIATLELLLRRQGGAGVGEIADVLDLEERHVSGWVSALQRKLGVKVNRQRQHRDLIYRLLP